MVLYWSFFSYISYFIVIMVAGRGVIEIEHFVTGFLQFNTQFAIAKEFSENTTNKLSYHLVATLHKIQYGSSRTWKTAYLMHYYH